MRAFRRAVEEARDETVCAQLAAPAQRSQPAAPQCAKPAAAPQRVVYISPSTGDEMRRDAGGRRRDAGGSPRALRLPQQAPRSKKQAKQPAPERKKDQAKKRGGGSGPSMAELIARSKAKKRGGGA